MNRYLFTFAVIVLAIVCMPWSASAQDTLAIAATPAGNLNTVINGDTLAGGVRAHPLRVYKLRRGNVYQVTEPMNINGNITIIANDSAGIRPPVLAPAILVDNSSIGTYFNLTGKKGKVVMRDLYFLAMRSDQAWLAWGSSALNVAADSVSIKVRNVVFDGFGNAINQNYWLKSDVQDCVFRNHMHTDSWFNGDPFMGGQPMSLDTTLWFNNTFMACGSYTWNIRGYTPLARFEHNTMLYSIVNPFLIRMATNLHIRNNVFYAQHAMGNPDHIINGWFLNTPDTSSSSMIRIRGNDSVSYWAKLWWDATNNKPSAFGGPEALVDAAHNVTAGMMDATKRVFEVNHNSWFDPAKLVSFRQTYNDTTTAYDSINVPVYMAAANPKMRVKRTLIAPTYLNNYSKWTIDSLAGMLSNKIQVDKNPITGDPGFPANVAAHVDSVIWYINTISTNSITQTRRWAFPSNKLYPPTWPLPENLAYTNVSMQSAASDGLPLGDLNWFPAKKALWVQPTTAVEELSSTIPDGYSLSQNYPNPFNPSTTIQFSVPKASQVSLKVYNMLGQEVATLVNGQMGAGSYSAKFDASKLASGTYIYRLTADNFVTASKMLLLK